MTDAALQDAAVILGKILSLKRYQQKLPSRAAGKTVMINIPRSLLYAADDLLVELQSSAPEEDSEGEHFIGTEELKRNQL